MNSFSGLFETSVCVESVGSSPISSDFPFWKPKPNLSPSSRLFILCISSLLDESWNSDALGLLGITEKIIKLKEKFSLKYLTFF